MRCLDQIARPENPGTRVQDDPDFRQHQAGRLTGVVGMVSGCTEKMELHRSTSTSGKNCLLHSIARWSGGPIPNLAKDKFPDRCWNAIVSRVALASSGQPLLIFSAVKKPIQAVSPTIFNLVSDIFLEYLIELALQFI